VDVPALLAVVCERFKTVYIDKSLNITKKPGADAWWGPDGLGLPEGKQLSLRGLAAALRKQDGVNGALEALSRVC
jgi:hypothetical protein